jgi:hypothetical protein
VGGLGISFARAVVCSVSLAIKGSLSASSSISSVSSCPLACATAFTVAHAEELTQETGTEAFLFILKASTLISCSRCSLDR